MRMRCIKFTLNKAQLIAHWHILPDGVPDLCPCIGVACGQSSPSAAAIASGLCEALLDAGADLIQPRFFEELISDVSSKTVTGFSEKEWMLEETDETESVRLFLTLRTLADMSKLDSVCEEPT